MTDPRVDQIAREAARLMAIGRADVIEDAIHFAAESLGFRGVPLPGHGRVRKHAQAMAMQALGDAAYHQSRVKVWRIAEQLMSVFEHVMPEARTLLVGRAAQGYVDAGVTIHIRLYTRTSISSIVESLAQFGYDEPGFQTADTPHGRLSQIRLIEEGIDVRLTRCMPEMLKHAEFDLFSGKPIETIDLPALRRKLDESASQP